MSGIRCRRILPAVLLAAFLVHSPGPAAYAQAAKGKEAAKTIPAAEKEKLQRYFERLFRETVRLTQDEDDPASLEVEVGGALLGWLRRDEDGITGDNDFIFEWYILEAELED